jgi:hypothetical protein
MRVAIKLAILIIIGVASQAGLSRLATYRAIREAASHPQPTDIDAIRTNFADMSKLSGTNTKLWTPPTRDDD